MIASPAIARKPLATNISWALVGNAVYAATQWLVLVAIAQLGTPAGVGQVGLALALTAPVFMLTNMNLRIAYAVDMRSRAPFATYVRVRLATVGLSLAAIAIVGLGFSEERSTALVILLIGVGKAFDALSDVLHGCFQKRELMDRVSQSYLVNGVASLVLVAGVMSATRDVVLASAAWAFASLGTLAVMNWRVIRAMPGVALFGPAIGTQSVLRAGLPLGLVMLIVSLNANLPRYFIQHGRGSTELGVYTALVSFTVVGATLVAAVGEPMAPRLARHVARREVAALDEFVRRTVVMSGLAGGVACVAAWLWGDTVMRLVFSGAYTGHSGALTLMALATTLAAISSFFGYTLTAMGKFREQLVINIGMLALLAALCAALIPTYGVAGAATVGVLVFVVRCLVYGGYYLRSTATVRKDLPER